MMKKAEKIISVESTPKCKQDVIKLYCYETKIQVKDNCQYCHTVNS